MTGLEDTGSVWEQGRRGKIRIQSNELTTVAEAIVYLDFPARGWIRAEFLSPPDNAVNDKTLLSFGYGESGSGAASIRVVRTGNGIHSDYTFSTEQVTQGFLEIPEGRFPLAMLTSRLALDVKACTLRSNIVASLIFCDVDGHSDGAGQAEKTPLAITIELEWEP